MSQAKQFIPAAFMSYTHFDDEYNRRRLTEFREHLCAEVRTQTGEEFFIFQDRNDIAWGQNFGDRIERAISEVTLLIPIITPSFFKSQACRDELSKFLMREKGIARSDLILPLYYVDTPLLNDPSKRMNDEIAQAVALHQYADWRKLRFEPFTSPLVGKALEMLAIQIRNALERTASEEPSTHHFSGGDDKVKESAQASPSAPPEIYSSPKIYNSLNMSHELVEKKSSPSNVSSGKKVEDELNAQNPKLPGSGPAISTNNFYKKSEGEVIRSLNSGISENSIKKRLVSQGMSRDDAHNLVTDISKDLRKKE